ncbi:unnamed protein product [Paramecium primaurelia]|uniref:Golgi apparatus membrane protein TVP23 homolog n=2 Tax=Paramecium TaxID=5884 RepID=A0A8S1WKI1_9CILI|nr:unnamed protein product [Paramecium primaurelia]CAD8190604.1 unnamed protein product [Paramecium pentaurelia]
MEEDLHFKIQMQEMPTAPPKPLIQTSTDEPTKLSVASNSESLPLQTSNYDLNRASHPKACIFTCLFKALALIFYLIFGESIWSFILVIIFSAFDFWTVKNITGRLLVGLKWENIIMEDGTSKWEFYSIPNKQVNAVDKTFFWTAQLGFTLAWAVFTFSNMVSFTLMKFVIDVIGLSLCWTNLFGYYKCNGDHKKKMKDLQGDITSKVVTQFVGQMMSK